MSCPGLKQRCPSISLNELALIPLLKYLTPSLGFLVVSSSWAVKSRVLKSDRTGLTAAFRYRFTGPVRPVTGGNRLNSNPNSTKFKNSHATGSDRFTGWFDRFTGRFYRFTGRFDRFEIQKLPCNRFDRFTDRFDRFTKWVLMGRLIFFFFSFLV